MTKRKQIWMVEVDPNTGKSFWTKAGEAVEIGNGFWELDLRILPMTGGKLRMLDPPPPKPTDPRNSQD